MRQNNTTKGKNTMKFLHFTTDLIKLIMSAQATAEQINVYQKQTSAWYMSEEGKAIYQKAITPTAKMRFFQSYLNAIKAKGTDREIVALAAYVITCGVEGTSLPFASFPEILDPKKNPVVKVISEKDFNDSKRVECGIEMLNALLGGSPSDVAEWYNPKKRPYENLETCSNNQSLSDMYKLQRYIIGTFCCLEDKSLAPYVYDIVASSKFEDSDNDDN